MTAEDIQDHIMRHRPKAAYLGRREVADMLAEYHRITTAAIPPDGYDDLAYCGCRLLSVDKDSHVGFDESTI